MHNWGVLQRGIGVYLALQHLAIRTCREGVEQDQVGLKTTRGLHRGPIVMFFLNQILPGPFQRLPDQSADSGLMIDEENFLGESHRN